jgi:ubiquinone/menaquinone biosynthesis C-methylase UbiE
VGVKEYWEDLARSGAWSTARKYEGQVDANNYNCITRRECVQQLLAVDGKYERVLDIGCGTGDYFTIAKDHQASYHGMDWSWHMARGAVRKVDAQGRQHLIVVGSGVGIPYASNCFDVVLAIGFIEYFADPDGAIKEICRVLKPGGILVMQSFKPDLFGTLSHVGTRLRHGYQRLLSGSKSGSDKSWPWEKQYSRRGLDSLLMRSGFVRVDYRFNNHWIYFRSLQLKWPSAYIRISDALNRANSAWSSFLAVNYVGKYRLLKAQTEAPNTM